MPYRDSEELLTIGYGICVEITGITPGEAEFLLRNRVNVAISECMGSFDWFEGLDPVRQAVVSNMVYNLGINRFKGFKKTIAHIAAGNYGDAATEMLDSKWARQVGRRATELSQMMDTGHWL